MVGWLIMSFSAEVRSELMSGSSLGAVSMAPCVIEHLVDVMSTHSGAKLNSDAGGFLFIRPCADELLHQGSVGLWCRDSRKQRILTK